MSEKLGVEQIMKEFTYNDKTVKFTDLTGEVLSSEKYSETHVSSSGGGGFVHGRHGGYVEAPRIRSKTITNHEFWLKTNDGAEVPIQFSGLDIPLRPGQKISLVTAQGASGEKFLVSLVNHSAKKHWNIRDTNDLNREFGLSDSFFKWFLKTSALVALPYLVLYAALSVFDAYTWVQSVEGTASDWVRTYREIWMDHSDLFFLPAILAGLFILHRRLTKRSAKMKKFKDSFTDHVKSIIDYAYEHLGNKSEA